MSSRRRRRLGSWLCVVSSLVGVGTFAGCAFISSGPRGFAACSGVLRPVGQIEGDFVLHQRVRIRASELDFPMRLVVQKTADELVAIGFNPIGAKLFTVQQRGLETEVEALPRAVLRVPPLNVLRDLHRTRFLAAPRPESGIGASTRSFDGTAVVDTWLEGELVRRELSSPDHPTATTLRFEPGSSVVVIDNPSCGYSSQWTTLSEEAIR